MYSLTVLKNSSKSGSAVISSISQHIFQPALAEQALLAL
jgi:hypothetical protein